MAHLLAGIAVRRFLRRRICGNSQGIGGREKMTGSTVSLYVGLTWCAVLCYVAATVANTWGIVFGKEKPERLSYFGVAAGLAIHTVAIVWWWRAVGHGPYMAQSEVLSSDAWIVMVLFLGFSRLY